MTLSWLDSLESSENCSSFDGLAALVGQLLIGWPYSMKGSNCMLSCSFLSILPYLVQMLVFSSGSFLFLWTVMCFGLSPSSSLTGIQFMICSCIFLCCVSLLLITDMSSFIYLSWLTVIFSWVCFSNCFRLSSVGSTMPLFNWSVRHCTCIIGIASMCRPYWKGNITSGSIIVLVSICLLTNVS